MLRRESRRCVCDRNPPNTHAGSMVRAVRTRAADATHARCAKPILSAAHHQHLPAIGVDDSTSPLERLDVVRDDAAGFRVVRRLFSWLVRQAGMRMRRARVRPTRNNLTRDRAAAARPMRTLIPGDPIAFAEDEKKAQSGVSNHCSCQCVLHQCANQNSNSLSGVQRAGRRSTFILLAAARIRECLRARQTDARTHAGALA